MCCSVVTRPEREREGGREREAEGQSREWRRERYGPRTECTRTHTSHTLGRPACFVEYWITFQIFGKQIPGMIRSVIIR